jgi:shikimate kinase
LTTTEDDQFAVPDQRRRAVLLVGFMGAGKTSVGKALAERLHWRFLDLDEVVVAREGRDIAAIFRESGEQGFRARESAALQELLRELKSSSKHTVVAMGGGAVIQPENRDAISSSGFPVIFLDAPASELFQRCTAQNIERPLLNKIEDFEQLYRSRQSHYAMLGARLDTSGSSVNEICNKIQESLGLAEEHQ